MAVDPALGPSAPEDQAPHPRVIELGREDRLNVSFTELPGLLLPLLSAVLDLKPPGPTELSAGLSRHTRRAYASRLAGYLRWLDGAAIPAAGDPTGADPLADAWARDFAVRDYRTWLLTVAKRSPATINAHLTAIDAFYTHLGLGAAHADRIDLPPQAPPRPGPRGVAPGAARR